MGESPDTDLNLFTSCLGDLSHILCVGVCMYVFVMNEKATFEGGTCNTVVLTVRPGG